MSLLLAAQGTLYTCNVSETVTLAEGLARATTTLRVVNDGATLVESLARATVVSRAFSDRAVMLDEWRNEVRNPSAEVDNKDYRAFPGTAGTGASTPTRVITDSVKGAASIEYVVSVLGSNGALDVWNVPGIDSGPADSPVAEGDFFFVRSWAKVASGTVPAGGRFRIWLRGTTSTSAFIQNFTTPTGSGTTQAVVNPVVGTWYELTAFFQTTSLNVSTTHIGPQINLEGTVGNPYTVRFDGVQCIKVPSTSVIPPYFDGTTTNGQWLGTADLSKSITPRITRLISFPRASTDSTTLAESSTRTASYSRSSADAASASEALARITVRSRAFSDSVGVSEALARTFVGARSLPGTITIADVLTRVGTVSRPVTDTLTLSESLTRVRSAPRSTSDAITFSESLARSATHPRSFSDAVTLSEALARSSTAARSFTDAASLSESLARTTGLSRTLAETVTVAEALARTTVIFRSPVDAVTLSESLASLYTPGGNNFSRSVSDAVTLTEVVLRSIANGRLSTETVTLSESLARTTTTIRAASDAVALADACARLLGYARAVSTPLSLVEFLTTGANVDYVVNVNDVISLSDGLGLRVYPPGFNPIYLIAESNVYPGADVEVDSLREAVLDALAHANVIETSFGVVVPQPAIVKTSVSNARRVTLSQRHLTAQVVDEDTIIVTIISEVDADLLGGSSLSLGLVQNLESDSTRDSTITVSAPSAQ